MASPGPATLAIVGTSMSQGRKYSIFLSFGILTGSLLWSTTAAFGLAALLKANVWAFEFMRYCGALYLLYLAVRSLRSAYTKNNSIEQVQVKQTLKANYLKGLFLHLTNPKAILFFGSLYSIGIPPHVGFSDLISVILMMGGLSAVIFLGYAVIFSSAPIRNTYIKLRRIFELIFGITFGFAGIKLLFNKITQ
jgi:threonine/homoserine/homoserine lactone efflux protein